MRSSTSNKQTNKMISKSLIALVLILAFISTRALSLEVEEDEEVDADDKPVVKVERHDIGSLISEVYHYEYKSTDLLTLKKELYKTVLSKKTIAGAPEPIFVSKISSIGDLVPCKNISLAVADQLNSIRCKPIDDWVDGYKSGKSYDRRHQIDYALRYIVRIQNKALFANVQTPKRSAKIYLLDEDHVNERIELLTESSGLTDLGFIADRTNMGYYFEADSGLKSISVRCTGNVYLSFNRTDSSEENGSWDFFVKSNENGVLTNIELSCSDLTHFKPMRLDIDLTIIKRQQFPYLTLKNEMLIRPMTSTWNYTGTISQTREPNNLDDQTDAYNTTIRIQSMSDLFELLNFNLDQTFAHKDSNTGSEEMIFSHPKLTAFVKSDWTFDSLSKSLNIYFMEAERLLNLMIVSNPTPAFSVTFDDKPEEPHLNINLKLGRYFLRALTGSINSGPNKATPQETNYKSNLDRDEL